MGHISTFPYLRNINWLYMSICCDINMLGVVEHKRSLRGTQGSASLYCRTTFLYLRNINWLYMSIYCDINTLGAVEHKRSLRGTQGIA
jgi:hypothetical protein